MQRSLNTLHEYCQEWKLKINLMKTNFMIFSCGKIRNLPDLIFWNSRIEVVFEYNYLRIFFNYNGNFSKPIESLYDKGLKAMFSLLHVACNYLLTCNSIYLTRLIIYLFIYLLGFIYTNIHSNTVQLCNWKWNCVHGCQIQVTSTLTMFNIKDKIVYTR